MPVPGTASEPLDAATERMPAMRSSDVGSFSRALWYGTTGLRLSAG
jgi:hypothetical protein